MKLVLPSLVVLSLSSSVALATAFADGSDSGPSAVQASGATVTQVPAVPTPAVRQGHSNGIPPGALFLGTECSTIDFEDFTEGDGIGTVIGVPNVTFGPSWFVTTDNDEPGGLANIANEPSASNVALFTSDADPINFDLGVRFVEIFYSASAASVPVTLTAWDDVDGTGNIVDMQSGSTIGVSADGANCTGDPTGNFCLWDTIALTAPDDTIRSITIDGAATNSFAFDDMQFCTDIPCDMPASNTPLVGSNINPAGTLMPMNLPTIGNASYGVEIDDRFDACGLSTGGVATFLFWSRTPIQAMVPNLGCGVGAPGEIFVGAPFTLIRGPEIWAPGQPAVFPVPIPDDLGLCDYDCYAQGFFLDPSAPGGPYIVTNALSVIIGI